MPITIKCSDIKTEFTEGKFALHDIHIALRALERRFKMFINQKDHVTNGLLPESKKEQIAQNVMINKHGIPFSMKDDSFEVVTFVYNFTEILSKYKLRDEFEEYIDSWEN